MWTQSFRGAGKSHLSSSRWCGTPFAFCRELATQSPASSGLRFRDLQRNHMHFYLHICGHHDGAGLRVMGAGDFLPPDMAAANLASLLLCNVVTCWGGGEGKGERLQGIWSFGNLKSSLNERMTSKSPMGRIGSLFAFQHQGRHLILPHDQCDKLKPKQRRRTCSWLQVTHGET